MQRIVLAYSGGLKSAIAVPWLADAGAAEIVTVTLDFGEGRELEAVRDSALAAGAVRAHVLDVLEEFTKDFFLRALKAGAAHARGGAPGLALSRAIVARKLIEIAGIERAAMIAHGCAASDTRIDAAIAALQPGARVVAPAREWTFTRDELASFARDRRVPLPLAADRAATPRAAAPTAAGHPAEPAYVDVAFRRGLPIAVNGVAMPLLDLMGSLDIIARAHGVGRDERPETPAAAVLHAAHAQLQHAVTDRADQRATSRIARDYADLIDDGSWFTSRREALDAEVDALQQRVSGIVRLKLLKGACEIVGTMPGDARLETDGYSVVRPLRFRA